MENLNQQIQQLTQKKSRNIATFGIRLEWNEQNRRFLDSREFNDTFFISGGDAELMETLKRNNQQEKFVCILDYTVDSQFSSDCVLRKTMAGFFGLVEDKTNPQYQLLKAHNNGILKSFMEGMKEGVFTEILLTDLSVKRIQDLLGRVSSNYASHMFFTEDSKKNLVDKQHIVFKKSKEEIESIDELFTDIQLHFRDSEQTIRLFIDKLSTDPDTKLGFKGGMSLIQRLFKDAVKEILGNISSVTNDEEPASSMPSSMVTSSSSNPSSSSMDFSAPVQPALDPMQKKSSAVGSSLPKKQKKEGLEEHQLEKIALYIFSQLRDWDFSIILDIPSTYDMCSNCQSTYLHDIIEKRHIQSNILLKLFEEALRSVSPYGGEFIGFLKKSSVSPQQIQKHEIIERRVLLFSRKYELSSVRVLVSSAHRYENPPEQLI